ncbi:PrtP precursor, partial [Lactobacillus helveticus MTCC 5463]
MAAAIIALASGSTVFLSQNTAEAATNDPGASDVQVKVVQQDQKQDQNSTANAAVSNSDSAKTQTNATDQTQNSTVVSGDSTTANSKTSQTSNAQTTSTTTNSVDPNQEQQPANQADHVKGNVQSAWDQGYRGQGTVVAVIDSGADPTHKDFKTMPEDPKLSEDDFKIFMSW